MTDRPIQLANRHDISRRDVLRAFAAGAAALEVACLQRPGEEIRPAVNNPETHPGTPQRYATAFVDDGFATGLVVESHEGRPTKIEGNPGHPASLGGTSAQHQASILDLYDPYRLRAPERAGVPASWNQLRAVLATPVAGATWIVLPPESSPTIARLLERVRDRRPDVHVIHHAAIDHRVAYRGTELAFGVALEQQLALDRADAIVALDADVLGAMPMALRRARDFAGRRRAVEPGDRPPRLFVAEPMWTPTGSIADSRLAVRASDVAALAVALAVELGVSVSPEARRRARVRVDQLGAAAWIASAVRALRQARSRSVVVVGDRQPAAVHALAHRIALSLGAVGETTTFTEPAVVAAAAPRLADLAAALRTNQVGALIAIDVTLDLGELVARAPLSIHATLRPDPLSSACQWIAPLSHYLESWGDARAFDGTASVIQPLIQPLHATRSPLQILAMLAGESDDDRALVRQTWRAALPDEPAWHRVLADGVIPASQSPARTVAPTSDALDVEIATPDALELALAPSPAIGDGRFAANPWLQELPHPFTKQTWGNAALVGVATARSLGVADGDVLRVTARTSLDVPVIVVAGHAEDAITIELGYGRRSPPIADHGVDGNVLTGGASIIAITTARTGRRIALARTQEHTDQHGRPIAPHVDLAYYRAHPDFTAELRGELPTLREPHAHPPGVPQWAMTIDTTICTGCSACVIACQAENNIPVVGADGVRRNREMHWLRIDTYYEHVENHIEVVHQPMLCQHCEHAPCEYVCPTFATAHSPDGLNEMTYNRCVGTRFCSNNCPYKVRRFNFFAYDEPVTLRSLQHNPSVTVRARGVMEKCTYCVQRIRAAEIRARMDHREIRPGEVVTACQQACPTTAIQFGALEHADTAMVQWRAAPRHYAVLHDLGTRPRTLYLAKIRNRDPEDS